MALCRRENVDVIVAIGGGSVIDCAKVVSAAVCSTLSPWELVLHPQEIKKSDSGYCGFDNCGYRQ